jgi:protein-L-isoaspartate(D-aspartate) O-methyltransferase
MDRLEAHRQFFARLVTASAGVPPTEERLVAAFASTPRERFVGAGPWQVFTRIGYIQTPGDDPALLYQDITIALKKDQQINNGQPMLHAACLAALGVQEGESVVHIGAGTGYYTALLAHLTGPTGSVIAYEIDPELADQAAQNLKDLPHVTVHSRSGTEGELPECDVLYVNAGATGPPDMWLGALRPGGRLLFPLAPPQAPGFMLLVTRMESARFTARFVCGAMFIPCIGACDDETAQKLSAAFRRGDFGSVRSLRRDASPDATCWCAGNGWWLSTAEPTDITPEESARFAL